MIVEPQLRGVRLPTTTRLFLSSACAVSLIGAAEPETRFAVTLRSDLTEDAGGRLLVFAAPATSENATKDAIDLERDLSVSVAARDVPSFGASRSVAARAWRTTSNTATPSTSTTTRRST